DIQSSSHIRAITDAGEVCRMGVTVDRFVAPGENDGCVRKEFGTIANQEAPQVVSRRDDQVEICSFVFLLQEIAKSILIVIRPKTRQIDVLAVIIKSPA